MSAVSFLIDWLLWVTSIAATGAGYAGTVLVAVLAMGIVGVARHDWAQGRRPFDKINAR